MCDTAKILSEYKDKPGFDPQVVADLCDIRYQSLMRILNEYDVYDLGVRKLIPFIQATKDFTLLDHIESRLGRIAFNLSRSKSHKMDLSGVCSFIREAGEAMKAISDALTDGKVTRNEAISCRRELMELVQVSVSLLRHLDEIEKG